MIDVHCIMIQFKISSLDFFHAFSTHLYDMT